MGPLIEGSYGLGKARGSFIGRTGAVRLNMRGSLQFVGSGFSASEIRMAMYMSALGNKVVLRSPPVGPNVPRTSDLMINGKKWDVYTPTTGSVNSILRMLSKKGSQVEGGGVIIDLSRSPLTLQDLRNANFFERAKNRSSKFSKVLVFT